MATIHKLLCLLIIASFGCNTAKRLTKAEQLVLTNKEAFNRVGAAWAYLNPCVNDTTIVKDTVTYIEFFDGGSDTIYKRKLDTVIVEITKQVTKTIYKDRVIEKSVRDVRCEKQLTDANAIILSYAAIIEGKESEVKKLKSKITLQYIIMGIVFVLFIAGFIIKALIDSKKIK